MTDRELLKHADRARKHSYSPYSGYAVGAALLCRSGKIYLGTNVENASYGLGICAERSAACQAIVSGEREFVKIAVVSDDDLCPPCGACRQVLWEFGRGMKVILGKPGATARTYALKDLLPQAFPL